MRPISGHKATLHERLLRSRTVRPGGATYPVPCDLADGRDPGRSGSPPRAAAGRSPAGGTGTPAHDGTAVHLHSARQGCMLFSAIEPRGRRSQSGAPSRGCSIACSRTHVSHLRVVRWHERRRGCRRRLVQQTVRRGRAWPLEQRAARSRAARDPERGVLTEALRLL